MQGRGNFQRGSARVRKYENHPTVLDGIRFPSKRQARRYVQLTLLARAGAITDLKVDGRDKKECAFPLVVNGTKVGTYRADFTYREPPTGALVVEDCKGFRTAIYRLKARLVLACHGVVIRET